MYIYLGIRIKAIEGDTGTISGVLYDDITLSSISKYGILIEQNYDGGDLDGGTASSGIPSKHTFSIAQNYFY